MWFTKEDQANECKANKDRLVLNVSDAGTQMELEEIDYGTKTKNLLKNYQREIGKKLWQQWGSLI